MSIFAEPPPEGKGCWVCHMEPPVVKLDSRYALCFTCLAGWFPAWSDDRVADWLIRQVERGQALARRKAPAGRQSEFNFSIGAKR